jgi:hypothetical protein
MPAPGSDTQALRLTRTAAPRNGGDEFRPYTWRDPDAGRQAEVERILARIRADAHDEPDVEPGYEYRRELLLAQAEEPPAVQVALPVPAPAPEPPGRREGCGYLTSRCCCPGGPRS